MRTFADRHEAGRALAMELRRYAGAPDALVLGLPRGGVVVAYEVASALGLPLDVFSVRKLGVPGQEELALGAIAPGGVVVLNEGIVRESGIDRSTIDAIIADEARELERRERALRGERPALDVRGRAVILVDDGLATGATMRSAAAALRKMGPARLVVAVPVGAPETCQEFRAGADEVVCAAMPEPFFGVGMWYDDFAQTSDQEVQRLLAAAWKGPAGSP